VDFLMNSWQTIAALLCVAWALGYVFWRGQKALRHPQASACSGCPKSNAGIQQSPIVPIDALLDATTVEGRQDTDR
jgi:hypothetical protein